MHLGSLRGMRIGIEAAVWLRKIDAKEPYQVIDHLSASLSLTLAQVAMGGIPLTLQKNIDDDLAKFACELPLRPLGRVADRLAASTVLSRSSSSTAWRFPGRTAPLRAPIPESARDSGAPRSPRTQDKPSMSAPLTALQRMGGARERPERTGEGAIRGLREAPCLQLPPPRL